MKIIYRSIAICTFYKSIGLQKQLLGLRAASALTDCIILITARSLVGIDRGNAVIDRGGVL